jgi:hypothetical protein
VTAILSASQFISHVKPWVGPRQVLIQQFRRESSEAYGGEFAQENDAVRPEDTIPWQKLTKTAETAEI